MGISGVRRAQLCRGGIDCRDLDRLLGCDADGEELLLLELLPHAASKSDTPTAGMSFVM